MKNCTVSNNTANKKIDCPKEANGKSSKKMAALFTALSFMYGCCACGSGAAGIAGEESMPGSNTGMASESVFSASMPEAGGSASHNRDVSSPSGLRFLCEDDGENYCSTEEGFYYLSHHTIELSDGTYGSRLMYMDYASCREIYLCSSPGCTHETPDCTAVLLSEEFLPYCSRLFLHQNSLYILCRQYDSEGAMVTEFADSGSSENFMIGDDARESHAVLYRMNPDGTGRQKVYSFDAGLTLEGTLAIDNNGLYVIAKKLSSEKNGAASYISTSERKLVYLDLSSFEARDICSMDFGDNITWKMAGCANGSILLRGTDYGKELTTEEYYDDDLFQNYYLNSTEVFASLDVTEPELKEFYRISNKNPLCMAVYDGSLYLAFDGASEIIGIDAATREQRTVASLPQTYIWGTLGDMLCCCSWDLLSDHTYYFVNTKTGEVRHSGLVNKSVGWSLDIKAETASDALVIYDYEATPSKLNEGGYEIHRYQYGLISKEDLYAGNDNFRKIQMVGKGD